jgi:hypothetical protein
MRTHTQQYKDTSMSIPQRTCASAGSTRGIGGEVEAQTISICFSVPRTAADTARDMGGAGNTARGITVGSAPAGALDFFPSLCFLHTHTHTHTHTQF